MRWGMEASSSEIYIEASTKPVISETTVSHLQGSLKQRPRSPSKVTIPTNAACLWFKVEMSWAYYLPSVQIIFGKPKQSGSAAKPTSKGSSRSCEEQTQRNRDGHWLALGHRHLLARALWSTALLFSSENNRAELISCCFPLCPCYPLGHLVWQFYLDIFHFLPQILF